MNINRIFIWSLVAIVLATSVLAIVSLPKANSASFEEESTVSNVTINVWVEITLSSNLSGGITFGSLEKNTNDNNASGNYALYPTDNSTQFNVTAGAANTVNMDLCVKNNQTLKREGGSDVIGDGNYTYNFSATTDVDKPKLPGTAISATYTTTQHTNIAANAASHARFWLDIPDGQVAGTYVNKIYIKGIQTGTSCT